MRGVARMLLFLGVVTLATAETLTSPSPPQDSGQRNPHFTDSLVSSLLQAAGFSQTCVTAALDACSHFPHESEFSSFVKEARDTMREVRRFIHKSETRPRHCKDVLDSGDTVSGVRLVYPDPARPNYSVEVYCEQTVDGGGWTVFQRRTNDTAREDFYRTWVEYQLGFGNLEGEFWLGLDLLHQLTSTVLQELRVDMADYEGERRWAKYGKFFVGSPETKYTLSIGRYTGDAGDSFTGDKNKFSTKDADHDTYNSSCAQKFRGAWWYTACHSSNLNGHQYEGHHESYADGINWRTWKGHHYSLRHTTMMVRPAF